jgi:hypothetical protein
MFSMEDHAIYTFQGLAFRFVGRFDARGYPKHLRAHWEPARPSARGSEKEESQGGKEVEEPEEEAGEEPQGKSERSRSGSNRRRSRSRSGSTES